jgi:5-methylthioadenosine/S-adenosylhomocysteine deaminase
MDVRMHVHLSETKSEHEECKARHGGMSPAQYFNQCGIFDVPAIAAHCVWCEAEDFNILKEKGVTVASNPVSNLKLASGICNVTEMLKREIPVALGTDSVASNNNLSFFEEMKTFAILAKVREQNPTVITPKQALEAATINGALAQGRYDCGTIKEGNKADLLVLRTDTANMHPVHNMLNNIVYSATDGDIVMTMADGKVLYKDGEYTTIDIEKTIFETEAATAAILKQL